MPADIRNFFGGKGATPIRSKEATKEEDPGKTSQARKIKGRKIIDDSDDDEPPPVLKKSTTNKNVSKKSEKIEPPKGEETSTSAYFASSNKSKSSKPSSANSAVSTTKKPAISYSKFENDDGFAHMDDDKDAGDDIFAAEAQRGSNIKDDYVEILSDEDDVPVPKRINSKSRAKSQKKDQDVEMIDAREDNKTPKKLQVAAATKKRKSVELESEAEFVVPDKSPLKKPPAKKRAPPKKAKESESTAVQGILDTIPTIRAPSPPPKDPDAKPFDWRSAQTGGGNAGPPPASGTKEIPVGEENCLAGLTFVFTGLLESISREEGQELVKRYGGKITMTPSSKTSYVVLGSDAGPSKLRKIKEMNIKTINEDGLFETIRRLPANGGDGKAAEKSLEKKKAEEAKVREEAKEMQLEEERKTAEAQKRAKELQKIQATKGGQPASTLPQPVAPLSSQLWTTRYAPTQMKQICGNKGQVERIEAWLRGWANAHKYNFQKRGADGLGGYRAIMVHGPPGIGKTTAAHLAATLAGYDILESNASDTRSKKMVETGVGEVLNNTSILGFFAGDGQSIDQKKKNIVLIMDEVDGMSAGDRGGVGALAKLCKTTEIPMILICNERSLPKMKPFDFVTFDMPFRRPTVEQIRSRIATICHREKIPLPMQVIDALIEGSNKDIRQIINMLSTIKLDQKTMDFDKSKQMTKAWEKHVVLKPWDITSKLLGSGMFAPSSKATLNDKIELYFNDHEFSPLMIQENYLSTKPLLVNDPSLSPREQRLKALQLAEQAAESISDGDLVDRMIHGSQQQWSLMPTHAVFSTVRPCSFVSGSILGRTRFTGWLGNNSKGGKLARCVKEIQSHMRLRSSADRHEIRQQYLPVLWTQLVRRLEVEGKACVDEVIDLMDSYFLTREDFDSIMELGLGPQDQESVKLDTQTKAAFTRSYNSRTHPLPFMKANNNVMAPSKASKVKPDLEEAIDEDDDAEEVLAEPKKDDEEDDLKKDKYIKQPKAKKAAAKNAAGGKGKRKSQVADDDDILDDDSDVKPKKRATAKGKGKK